MAQPPSTKDNTAALKPLNFQLLNFLKFLIKLPKLLKLPKLPVDPKVLN